MWINRLLLAVIACSTCAIAVRVWMDPPMTTYGAFMALNEIKGISDEERSKKSKALFDQMPLVNVWQVRQTVDVSVSK